MPLINDILVDLCSALCYCFLDMAVGLGRRYDRKSKAGLRFLHTLGLFERLHMQFRHKDAPRIYQRLLYSAFYGIVRIPQRTDPDEVKDLFALGGLNDKSISSILGRHPYS